mmetsp:Transcript_13979/g.30681  ORF Transcript_13979/g.30681 Transcript_13979/m.30681 type:complete len:262 (+) Transcript_13979:194-979(+)
MRPSCDDGLLDGVEGRGAQEEGRLPDGLGGVHGEGVVGVRQVQAEVRGHVVEGRDLVSAWSFCEQRPGPHPGVVAVPPYQLLHGAPAEALHERSLDLPDVQGWVYALAHIHQHVGSQDSHVPREAVDLHLAHGHALGEVVEGQAALRVVGGLQVPVVTAAVRVYGVVAVRAQVDSLKEGRLRECRPGQLRARGAQRRQSRVDLLAGVDDRHPVQVGAGGGRGGGGVGDGGGGGLRGRDEVLRDAQHLRGDLYYLRVQAWAV